jgi:hypothetical protein
MTMHVAFRKSLVFIFATLAGVGVGTILPRVWHRHPDGRSSPGQYSPGYLSVSIRGTEYCVHTIVTRSYGVVVICDGVTGSCVCVSREPFSVADDWQVVIDGIQVWTYSRNFGSPQVRVFTYLRDDEWREDDAFGPAVQGSGIPASIKERLLAPSAAK